MDGNGAKSHYGTICLEESTSSGDNLIIKFTTKEIDYINGGETWVRIFDNIWLCSNMVAGHTNITIASQEQQYSYKIYKIPSGIEEKSINILLDFIKQDNNDYY